MNSVPHLLLLPGLVCDSRLWQQQIFDLADSAHCTVADLSGANSIPALAESAIAQAPPGHFALAGLSLGGYVALEIMRQAPNRVMALALLDTNARPDTDEARRARRRLMREAGDNYAAVIAELLPKLVHPRQLDNPPLLALITAMANTLGNETFIRQQQAMLDRVDSRPGLAKIHCPRLVLCGREDTITPLEMHQEMQHAIPNARLSIIEHCGHLSTLEQPLKVTYALTQWLLHPRQAGVIASSPITQA